MKHCEYMCISKPDGSHHDSCPANPNPPEGGGHWVMLPITYQPDTADSRKESGLTYAKYYPEEVVEKMENQIDFMSMVIDSKQEHLDEVTAERDEAREQLKIAVQYLRAGKAQFAPHTTNSLVDDFIKRHT